MKNSILECGILFNNGTSGSIMTPGYPITNYPNNVDCHFEILAPVGKTVRLRLLTDSSKCLKKTGSLSVKE